jgi:hypothetical protein
MFKVRIESRLTKFIKNVEITPNTTPRIIAPIVSYKNSLTIYKGGMLPPFTNYNDIVNKTIHVPSLKRLSPSISELNFFGAPASFSNANTATVSVHDKTEPNMNAYG